MSEPFGRYQLLKRIASGGMGEVFLARQDSIQGFEKLLVIKTLLPHLAEHSGFTSMFLDEARIAARLAHPNVVQIFDLGEVQGVYYIAMEYVHGDELRKVWKRLHQAGLSFPVALSVRIVSDAASGLGYAHRLADSNGQSVGLVHRDVSPHNVLVTFDGGVKLIDFGVAKAAGRLTNTQGGTLKGKYAYMSPEQVDGEDIDNRSDIFSLGIVLWELLTGSRLFKRESDVKTMRAVSDCEVVPASVKNPVVPPALDPIVQKALAQNRKHRYQSMEELRLDLETWLSQAQQAGATAHLAAFMRGQFSEQLAREGNKGPMWDVDPEATGFSPLSGTRPTSKPNERSDTSIKSLVQGSPADVASLEISMPSLPRGPRPARAPGEVTPATAVEPLRPRKPAAGAGRWLAGLGAATLGGLVLWRVTSRPPPPPSPQAPMEAPSAPAQAPPVARPVRIHLSSEPPGAVIKDGDSSIGVTPADLVFPREKAAVNLSLFLKGYRPITRGVDLAGASADAPVQISVTLEAEAPPQEAPPAATPQSPASPKTPKAAPHPAKKGNIVKAFE